VTHTAAAYHTALTASLTSASPLSCHGCFCETISHSRMPRLQQAHRNRCIICNIKYTACINRAPWPPAPTSGCPGCNSSSSNNSSSSSNSRHQVQCTQAHQGTVSASPRNDACIMTMAGVGASGAINCRGPLLLPCFHTTPMCIGLHGRGGVLKLQCWQSRAPTTTTTRTTTTTTTATVATAVPTCICPPWSLPAAMHPCPVPPVPCTAHDPLPCHLQTTAATNNRQGTGTGT
jgi:hypothetical protein